MLFEDLQAFVAVARQGSFTHAAAESGIATSALSKRVQRLEHRVGAVLFERRARGVVLTVAGHAFLGRARRLVDEMAELQRGVSGLVQTPSGDVRVALPQRTAGLLAPALVDRCRRELPLVQLTVLEGTSAQVHGWLMRGEADLAVSHNPELGTGYTARPLFTEPLFGFARPAGLADGMPLPEGCGVADLAALPLLLPRRPDPIRLLVERLCAGHGLRARVAFEADGTATLRGMAERGMGMAIFALSTTWSQAVEAGTLSALPFASPLMSWTPHLVRSRRADAALAIHAVHERMAQEIDALFERGAWPHARRAGDA